jgi:hypothetical protein
VLATGDLLRTIATIWIAKTVYEILALPASIPFANWLKRAEQTDVVDDPQSTDYSPFHLGLTSSSGPRASQ